MEFQALIIGLGQFGMSVARALADRSVEVLAVDVDEERVRRATPFVADAACFDATDADALASTAPERRDVCVCAIGEEARESSIICTALLRQFGARRVIARANTDVQARILTLVGAHQVINPEREFGERFATQIVHADVKGELPLGGGVLITEASVPAAFVGRTLEELRLPSRFAVTVVALRRSSPPGIVPPTPGTMLLEGDVLVLVARDGAVRKMLEEIAR